MSGTPPTHHGGILKWKQINVISVSVAQNEMRRRGQEVEALIASERPELLDLFLIYQNEAIAARKFLESSLSELNVGAKILEVGGGILALAIQLASEGYKVSAVEPAGKGFNEITYLMQLYSNLAKHEGLEYKVINSPIEHCNFDSPFDFIFSFNVMEHLSDPFVATKKVLSILNEKGRYRFFCPNYDFPYEPHFGKWMIFRKNGAFFLKPSKVSTSNISMRDAEGLYETLNFLTLKKIRKYLQQNKVDYEVNSYGLYELMTRSLSDAALQNRHLFLFKLVTLIRKLKLFELTKHFPVNFQPTMDVTLYKS